MLGRRGQPRQRPEALSQKTEMFCCLILLVITQIYVIFKTDQTQHLKVEQFCIYVNKGKGKERKRKEKKQKEKKKTPDPVVGF